ncbi:hypothetical protein [Desulfonema limicola]|uniref:hypothetical protein n=1 Tax=Desulfonema limicola TaxID=45656 RepID=UPI001A9B9097|nr:hypothetical protein [Desulfonema limicola]
MGQLSVNAFFDLMNRKHILKNFSLRFFMKLLPYQSKKRSEKYSETFSTFPEVSPRNKKTFLRVALSVYLKHFSACKFLIYSAFLTNYFY